MREGRSFKGWGCTRATRDSSGRAGEEMGSWRWKAKLISETKKQKAYELPDIHKYVVHTFIPMTTEGRKKRAGPGRPNAAATNAGPGHIPAEPHPTPNTHAPKTRGRSTLQEDGLGRCKMAWVHHPISWCSDRSEQDVAF